MSRRIIVDVDGVLGNWTSSYLRLYEQMGGRIPGTWAWTEFNAHKNLPDYEKYNARIWKDSTLFWHIAPILGAIRALYNLNRKRSVYIATAVPAIHHDTRSEWFREWFPFIHRQRQLIFTGSKHLLQADVMVDDQPRFLNGWAAHNPGGQPVLILGAWNKELPVPENTLRFHRFSQWVEWELKRADL